jgi:predicted phage terminase large subunit-like protein
LVWLNTEILHFKVLGSRFSRECQSFLQQPHNRLALFAPRKSYKTLTLRGFCIQEILKDPSIHIAYVSQELELAERAVNAVGLTLLKNPGLRRLLGSAHSPKTTGKWLRDGEFEVPGRLDPTDTTPTLKAYSTGQDMTGFRADIIIADDIIGKKVVRERGGVEFLDGWWQDTALPVIGLGTAGRAVLVGTFWSNRDLYQDIVQKWTGTWRNMVRGIQETAGKPDPEGEIIDLWMRRGNSPDSPVEPVSMSDVEAFKLEMGSSYGPQMLNIPSLDGDRPWPECEDGIEIPSIQVGEANPTRVVLIDPAPVGASKEHDFWANAVIGVYSTKDFVRRVLLDGRASQVWDVDSGILNALELARKWNATLIGVEEPPSAYAAKFYVNKIQELARMKGMRIEVVAFKNRQQSKLTRIANLISEIKSGTFMLCRESCDPKFLEDFYLQGRSFPSAGHDDVIDSCAFINDSAVQEFLPQSRFHMPKNIFDEEDDPKDQYRSPWRFC